MKLQIIISTALVASVTVILVTFWTWFAGAGEPRCELPSEFMDSIHWINEVMSLEPKEKLNCTGNNSQVAPIVMEYDESSKQDRLRKQPGYEHLICRYDQLHYESDNVNYYDEKWHLLSETDTLTRELLINCSEDAPNDGLTKFVKVKCLDSDNVTVYQNVHMFMPDLHEFQAQKDGNSEDTASTKPSVLVLAIETMTRLNFLRSMPKTAQALRDIGPVFYMKGFTRLADNTFPNMFALFTGRKVEDEDEGVSDRPLDNLPTIWKMFQHRGYPTALIDDNPNIVGSIMSYRNDAFLKPPTTFYPQPFWTYSSDPEDGQEGSNCIGTQAVPELLLNQVGRFMRHSDIHGLAYFTLAMLIRTTHYDWRNAEILDDFYEPFIRRISGQLNNTILIVMGDHGDRYSSEMKDYEAGKIESRLPLMAIRLPPTLLKKWPQMGDVLLKNKKRLTTMLDVHKTLVDIARLTKPVNESEQTEQVYTDSAYSLVTELVPLNRDCIQARIPDLFCVCRMKGAREANISLFESAAEQFVTQLNSILPEDKCQRLRLERINSVTMFDNNWLDSVAQKEKIELTVTVAPSNALLRTRMSRSAKTSWSAITVNHEIERLNLYGNQSHCIEHRVLRKYCICQDISVTNNGFSNSSSTLSST